MVQITLPDGSQREFPSPVTVAEVAMSIGAGLAKAALAGKVDGKVVDTSHTMSSNASLAIITAKDAEGLEVIRHSTAHFFSAWVRSGVSPGLDNLREESRFQPFFRRSFCGNMNLRASSSSSVLKL